MCCWSAQASFTLATAGFAGAYIAARNGHPWQRWAALVYFSGMETLQGITYSVIGDCGSDLNRVLTTVSYLHIAFQPIFVNLFSLTFIPKHKNDERLRGWVYTVCALTALTMVMMKAFPSWPAECNIVEQNMCSMVTCSFRGNWHIAWGLRLSNLDPHYLSYMFAAFAVPALYGAWRLTLYHILVGPLLASLLTSNKDEMPAVWCLLSIALLCATHIPWLNRLLGGEHHEVP